MVLLYLSKIEVNAMTLKCVQIKWMITWEEINAIHKYMPTHIAKQVAKQRQSNFSWLGVIELEKCGIHGCKSTVLPPGVSLMY